MQSHSRPGDHHPDDRNAEILTREVDRNNPLHSNRAQSFKFPSHVDRHIVGVEAQASQNERPSVDCPKRRRARPHPIFLVTRCTPKAEIVANASDIGEPDLRCFGHCSSEGDASIGMATGSPKSSQPAGGVVGCGRNVANVRRDLNIGRHVPKARHDLRFFIQFEERTAIFVVY